MKINKQCPKCGHDDSVMTFIPLGTVYRSNDADAKLVKKYLGKAKSTEYQPTTKSKTINEFIKIHCRTCQYSWVNDIISDLVLDLDIIERHHINLMCRGE